MKSRVTFGTFTPIDVEQISRASRDLQRTWRRRGFLPDLGGKHATFDLKWLVRITVMRRFTESGINLETCNRAAEMAVVPVIEALRTSEKAYAFIGDDWGDQDKAEAMSANVAAVAQGRYGFVPLPAPEHGLGVVHSADLDTAAQELTSDQCMAIVIDHIAVAAFIMGRSDKPLLLAEQIMDEVPNG